MVVCQHDIDCKMVFIIAPEKYTLIGKYIPTQRATHMIGTLFLFRLDCAAHTINVTLGEKIKTYKSFPRKL